VGMKPSGSLAIAASVTLLPTVKLSPVAGLETDTLGPVPIAATTLTLIGTESVSAALENERAKIWYVPTPSPVEPSNNTTALNGALGAVATVVPPPPARMNSTRSMGASELLAVLRK
jgi:hypothetical protein